MNNRSRGRVAENEVAALFGGKRISVVGLPGNDVLINGKPYEVKRIKKWPAIVGYWLAQAARQSAAGILVRADREPWLIIMPAKDYFDEASSQV